METKSIGEIDSEMYTLMYEYMLLEQKMEAIAVKMKSIKAEWEKWDRMKRVRCP